jgi:hypothetical protein
VATQPDIQCFFHLLHEPVDEKERCNDNSEENILSRLLPYVLFPTIFVLIMKNIGVTWLITLGQGVGGKTTMGVRNFGL